MTPKALRWLALPLLLAACVRTEPTGEEPLKTVTEAEIRAAIDLRPATLPELAPAALGLAGVVETQTRPDFKVGQAVYLTRQVHRSAQNPPPVGQIVAPGRVRLNLPAAPDLTQGETLGPLTWAQKFVFYDICALKTLRVGDGQEGVRLTQFVVTAFRPDLAGISPVTQNSSYGLGDQIAGSQPGQYHYATSPIPDYLQVLPYTALSTQTEYASQGQLVYADGDVTLKGELRCANRYVSELATAEQYNLRLHVELKKGWNSVGIHSRPVLPRGTLNIQETTVTGQASAFTVLN